MGRIIKYNITKSEGSGRVQSVTSATSGYPTNNDIKKETSCNFWGNDWHGYEDLLGSMLINGDVNIYWDSDDEDNDTYDEEEGDETPTGSLYVSGNIEGNTVYGKTVFLDYPNKGNKKTDLLDILKDFEKRIAKNTSDIGALDVRVTNNYNEIEALKSRTSILENKVTTIGERLEVTINNVQDNTNRIGALEKDINGVHSAIDILTTNYNSLNGRVTDNRTDIAKIYGILDNLEGEGKIPTIYPLEMKEGSFRDETYEPNSSSKTVYIPTKTSHMINDSGYITLDDIPEGDKLAPVVLFSGNFISENSDTTGYRWQPWKFKEGGFCYQNKAIYATGVGYGGETPQTVPSVEIHFIKNSGYVVKPTSVSAMVLRADGYNAQTSETGGNPRSRGYWMTGGVADNGRVYLNAWRTQDDNNDSVRLDCLAFRVQEITVTIYGQAYKE